VKGVGVVTSLAVRGKDRRAVGRAKMSRGVPDRIKIQKGGRLQREGQEATIHCMITGPHQGSIPQCGVFEEKKKRAGATAARRLKSAKGRTTERGL